MAKISLTLTDGGSTVYVDDKEVVKFQPNDSTGSLVYVYDLGNTYQVLNVTENNSQVAAKSPLFIALTQVDIIYPNATVVYDALGPVDFVAGEQVVFAGGASNGQIQTDNGSTSMVVTQVSGANIADNQGIRGVTSGATATVNGTPTYAWQSSLSFYLNSYRIIEFGELGSSGARVVIINDGVSPNGSAFYVSESSAAIASLVAAASYAYLGATQTWTGVNTFNDLVLTKGAVTQLTNKTTTVVLNTAAGVITTVALTDAANASFSFTVTNSHCTTTSIVLPTVNMNSSTGWANVAIVPANGSFVVTVKNTDASAAFNAALKIGFAIV